MKRLGFSVWLTLFLIALGGCATLDGPKPLTSDEVIALSKGGKSGPQIIEELKRTGTVIPLSASEIVRLHDAGVPNEVLDHLQRAQIDEILWRDRYSQNYWWGRGYPGFTNCDWPTLDRRARGRSWPC